MVAEQQHVELMLAHLMDAWAMHVQQTLLRCQDRFQIMITNK
ncbi:hypothetical protein RUMGNA_01408 [Mediterraneibacter gnavus ATCC 29149]|uniref:Uncharacterized protein n=1 Tax=Mediterraneibacter gnavus (strain ATCC 29149 / DSM 114966 / JCM 6515 / VPI C7-9) TaxID=411470 RepID=A7B1I2_MEDG7|nr:hypothetical protein RUMGNA_01408 [Mediterraneibacter gnavus ATCC 29149]